MAVSHYKGHEIEVKREESLSGRVLLYISIIRESDGYLVKEFPYDGSETVYQMMRHMKKRVDQEIEDGTTYEPE